MKTSKQHKITLSLRQAFPPIPEAVKRALENAIASIDYQSTKSDNTLIIKTYANKNCESVELSRKPE